MNNNDRYEVQVSANISGFKQKMKEMIQVSKETSEKVQEKTSDPFKNVSFKGLNAKEITEKYSQFSLKEVSDDVEEVSEEADEAGKSLGEMFSNATKNGKKFLLSLFSIRTIWSLVSKGANQYLQENEQLNQSVQLTASLLGNTLAPIIKVVVNAAQYAMIIVSELIRVFTGYDAIAGTVTNANKDIASSAKAANKQLSGFDELNNLTSSSSSSSSDITAMSDALGDFQEKVNKVREIFEAYEEPIKAATLALGVLVGTSMLSKIANLIGQAGVGGAAGTGLAGLGSSLAYIAAYSVIAIEVYYNIKIWKEIIEQGEEVVETYNDASKAAENLSSKHKELNDTYIEDYKAGKLTEDQMKSWNKTLGDSITRTSQMGNATRDNLSLWERMTGTNKANTTTLNNYNESLYTNGLLVANNAKELDLQGIELANATGKIYNAIAAIERNKDAMKEGSEEYDNANQMIKELQYSLNDLDGTYYADVNLETTTATSGLDRLYQKIKNIVTGKHTATVEVNGDTSKLRTTLGKLTTTAATSIFGSAFTWGVKSLLNSFDVGTNYVPNDMIAQIHKGEMIVPAKYNPATSGIGGSYEVVNKLNTLINVLENKEFNAYLDGTKITNRVISGINAKSRLAGGSVIK